MVEQVVPRRDLAEHATDARFLFVEECSGHLRVRAPLRVAARRHWRKRVFHDGTAYCRDHAAHTTGGFGSMLTAEGCRQRRQRLWNSFDPKPVGDFVALADPA